MMHPGGRRSAPSYDLFKLVVAMLLVIVLIVLLLPGRRPWPAQPATAPAQQVETVISTPGTPPVAASSLVVTPETGTALPPGTFTPETPPTVPPAVITPETEPAVTEAAPTSDVDACPSAPPRLRLGDKIRVLYRLNLRTRPGLDAPIILTNGVGTRLEVIGGPVCTFRDTAEGRRAYLWWNVRMEDDRQGWSAEAPLILSYYFLEPFR